jgi:hypothetical protein
VLGFHQETRRRCVGVQPPLHVCDSAVCRSRSAPAMDQRSFARYLTAIWEKRTKVVHLDLQRGVRNTCLQRGMNRAAHCRVQQGRSKSAMNEADRIVVILRRFTDEDRATFCRNMITPCS